MPGVARDNQPARPPPPPTWKPNKQDQAHINAIQVAIDRMRDHIPTHPYVMTIPQDVEPRYHHQHSTQATQWLSNTPFKGNEHEASQYLTNHYYEPGKEIYMLHNSQPIGDSPSGSTAAKQITRQGTGADTPNAGPKKKISLGAYKKKQSGSMATPERDGTKAAEAAGKQQATAAVKGPVERVKAETQEMLAAVAEDGDGEQVMRKEPSPEQGDLKRKRDQMRDGDKKKELGDSMEPDRSPKRQRLEKAQSPKKESVETTLRKGGVKTQDHAATTLAVKRDQESSLPPRLSPGMPPRLSPGLPEKLSPLHRSAVNSSPKPAAEMEAPEDEVDRLPPRLSPTLPDNIEKSLKARVQLQSSQSSNASAPASAVTDKAGKQSPTRKSEAVVAKQKSSVPRNGFRASSTSPAIRSDAEAKPQASTSAPRVKTPELSQDDEIAVGKALKSKRAEGIEDSVKASLMVRIKFKKASRPAITRILRMKSTPSKGMRQEEEPKKVSETAEKRSGERKEEPVKAKGVAQKIGPVKKDKKPADEDPPADKVPEKISDRQPKNTSAQEKRKLAEDEKPESAAKRKKLDMTESRKQPTTPAPRDVDSPQAQKSHHATPSTRNLLSQAMKREQSQESNHTRTPDALPNTPTVGSSQINGTLRPPSSQPISRTPKQQAWEAEQKKFESLGRDLKHEASDHLKETPADLKMAAVKSMESFLCFILSFTCADEAAATADPKQAPAYRNWRSLTGFYGFVKHHTGQYPPLAGLAASLGVVFCSRILEISILLGEAGPSRDTVMDTNALLHKAAAIVEEKLDIDTLQETFPRSWKERTKKLPSQERLELAKLGGQYKLPLGVATPPLRAVRAGLAMLQEWMQKEGIQYTLKLKL